MENLESFLDMMDYILNNNRKRHLMGGILLSMSALFGGLAITVMTTKKESDDE